jgi:hypothetical protein
VLTGFADITFGRSTWKPWTSRMRPFNSENTPLIDWTFTRSIGSYQKPNSSQISTVQQSSRTACGRDDLWNSPGVASRPRPMS